MEADFEEFYTNYDGSDFYDDDPDAWDDCWYDDEY